MSAQSEDDISSESVKELRERLSKMKRSLAERQAAAGRNPSIDNILSSNQTARQAGIIDANFLSFALCGALGVIVVVAIYAFYSLYNAVLKKFPSHHTEL
ncbi:uncharacterized protein LOC129573044 [Sitodiplosis mosellana]|uniref:uncharacterized protein LOC129573044 n=1 Tax=Sitodiplosis mosellana TaxID=263140 RepID=UPI0024444047|nr:uncharacterized protein LOC129573044 [Sitodiplosis mosellana]XP_055309192.1 uncharacterized protein LOC129573044 [Sitodiplosis mosellana]